MVMMLYLRDGFICSILIRKRKSDRTENAVREEIMAETQLTRRAKSPYDNTEFRKKLTAIVFPVAIQVFMLSLVNATDSLMLTYVSQDAMSATSLAGQIHFILNLLVSSLANGIGILTAQYWGKKDTRTIERIIPIGLRGNLLIGLTFMLLSMVFPRILMRIFASDELLIDAGATYLRYVAPSFLLVAISQIYLSVLKNTGRTRKSSMIATSAVIVNLIGNAILIFGLFGAPKLGIIGAAIATVFSRVFEMGWCMIETAKKDRVRVRWGQLFTRNKVLEGDFRKYTVPLLVSSLVWGGGYTSYSAIMGHLGSDAVAANSVTTNLRSMLICFARGESAGAGILVGNLLGAGDHEKAKDYARRLTHISIVTGMISGCLMISLAFFLPRFFPISDTAKSYQKIMMIFCGFNMMAQAVATVTLDGIFPAGGDTRFNMMTNVWFMWCFTIPLGLLAAFVLKWPPMAVYCIVNSDEIVKMPLVYKHYKTYVWLRNITRSAGEAGIEE